MKIENFISLGVDAAGDEIEPDVVAEATWERPDPSVGINFGDWLIEDVRFKDTNKVVPEEFLGDEVIERLKEIAAEEAFAREEAGRDARDDLRKEKTPW